MKKLLTLLLAISIPNFSLAVNIDDPREKLINTKNAESIIVPEKQDTFQKPYANPETIEQLTEEIKNLQEVGKQINGLNQQEQTTNPNINSGITNSGITNSGITNSGITLKDFASRVKSVFNWTAANINFITTKKGMITTLLLLGPLFTVYCYFFPPEPVKALIAYIFSASTKGAIELGATAGKGALNGAMEALNENPEEIEELISMASEAAVDIGFTFGNNAIDGVLNGLWNNKFLAAKVGAIYSAYITGCTVFTTTVATIIPALMKKKLGI